MPGLGAGPQGPALFLCLHARKIGGGIAMPTLQIGLFDIHQVDPRQPVGSRVTGEVFAQRLDDLALADSLGYAIAFTAERHFMPGYRCPSPGAWLGAASQRTQSMRLGVMAYTLPIHAPVQLAEEIAVLDHLCGGRLEVGFGLGHRPEELLALAVDPALRVPIYQEWLGLVRRLWAGELVTHRSPHVTLRQVAIHPLPAQQPHPPLWHAGTEPVAARWIGGQDLGLAVGFAPTPRLLPAVEAFRAGQRERAESARSDAPLYRPCGSLALMRHVYVAETEARAQSEITDDLLYLEEVRAGGSLGEGSRSERREHAAELAVALVRDELMIAGGPETVAALLIQAREALGIDLFLANVYASGVETARVHRTLRLLAGEVRERLLS